MFIPVLSYLALALGGLATLSVMILKIGTMLAHCPDTSARAQAAAVTIATGYAAIGSGGVILIGSALPVIGPQALFPALGLAALCLGLGFSHAVGTLRAVLAGPAPASLPNPPAA